MYKNTIKSAGVGVYRIARTRVWPAYINQTLWTLFDMSKEDFIRSIQMDNILGGRYTQDIDLIDCLCDGEAFCEKQGSIDAVGLSSNNAQIPLKVLYAINPIGREMAMLLVLIWRKTPEIMGYGDIVESLNAYHLIFNELDEIGLAFNKSDRSIKLKTTQFCLESCWIVDTKEMVNSFLPFVHPEDRAGFKNTLIEASEKRVYGDLLFRVCVMQQKYRRVKLWYSSFTDQNGNVNRILGLIERVPCLKPGSPYQHIKPTSKYFLDDKVLLYLEFDMDTNLRIRSEIDVNYSFSPCVDYPSTLATIREVFLHPDDRPGIDCLQRRYAALIDKREVYDFYCCDVRMLSCIDKAHTHQVDYRWYHISQELFFDIQAQKTISVLYVYDIHEFKHEARDSLMSREKSGVPCLLNFDTFILRFTEYFNSIRQANESPDYSALALVKVVIQLKPGGTMDEAFNQVMKTICASVHKDELCGKYSESVFAMLFHAQSQTEAIQERIRILDAGLSSIQNAAYSISAEIGYCIMPDCDPNTGSLLLERANVALFCAGLPGNKPIYQYTQKNEDNMKKLLSGNAEDADTKEPAQGSPAISIRTFGSFDIFVNNRAIPFSNYKAKELLAILVDRRGGFVTPSQAITYLWEDEPCNKKVLSRLRKVALLLKRQLEKSGVTDIVESVNGRRRLIIRQGLQCDYYELLSNDGQEKRYLGAYMPEYSWAESTNAILETHFHYPTESAK